MISKFRLSNVLGVAGLVAGLGFCAKPVAAQSFSSFIPVIEQSGLLVKLNGTDVTNLNVIGTNGIYQTGYETSGTPMVLKFTSAASGFLGVNVGDTLTVTRIGAVYLLDADGLTATTGNNTLYKQDGTTAQSFHWVNASAGGGVGYADDSNGFFSPSKNFLANSNSEGSGGNKSLFGNFGFTGISAGGTTNPTYLAFDLGGFVNGTGSFQTGHVLLTGLATTTNAVPEPGTYAMVAGMLVPGAAFLIRRRKA
jgi:hypothetical protein